MYKHLCVCVCKFCIVGLAEWMARRLRRLLMVSEVLCETAQRHKLSIHEGDRVMHTRLLLLLLLLLLFNLPLLHAAVMENLVAETGVSWVALSSNINVSYMCRNQGLAYNVCSKL